MKNFKEEERKRQEALIEKSDLFDGISGGGKCAGKTYPCVLQEGKHNLYAPITKDVIEYFRDNDIKWWGGKEPSGHVLSSQIACLNHLFLLRNDADAVLAMLNNICDEFTEVLPVSSDVKPSYIAFEVKSDKDYLNEENFSRGIGGTSIDALIYARHQSGELWLIPIEWKYTEDEGGDKSNEDREGEVKGSNGRGKTRMARYNKLIDSSKQLKSLDNYAGSIYYYGPFYQLMRQTLWVENVIAHKDSESLVADNYLHINIVPTENDALSVKKYKISGQTFEKSWRAMLKDQHKYLKVDPKHLLTPVASKYPQLVKYLSKRYWND